jgi:hypothetical protein
MSRQPRKGAPVRFAPADGILPPQTSDSVLGLRFNIEASYGGVVEVDLTDLRPRPFAVAFAGALRRQAELGGSLGAASIIKRISKVTVASSGICGSIPLRRPQPTSARRISTGSKPSSKRAA